jgi:drug/metabolite transporter (DMT)-like permease
MTLVKWIGTILCLIGIALTSMNVYPSNIWFGFVGSAVWAFAGVYQRDIPLFLVEFVAVLMYAVGIYYS